MSRGWWGFDFDGTMAEYDHWRGANHAGKPIAKTINRMKLYLQQGRDVRVFTARVFSNDYERDKEVQTSIQTINKFCLENLGQELPITCVKDMSMVALFDDRATQVEPNTGELIEDKLEAAEAIIRALHEKLRKVEELYYSDDEGDDAWASLGSILETDA